MSLNCTCETSIADCRGLREEASHYKPYSDDPDAPMIDEELAEELRETKDTISRHERNLKKYESNEHR